MKNLKNIIKAVTKNDEMAIARLISLTEENQKNAKAIEKALKKYCSSSYTVGITGAPGCGKSTIINRLITTFRNNGETIGVIAVDPTSPVTGGAILGDRIRMSEHFLDNNVFIRSMATRGGLGGISHATSAGISILSASGKDIIFVETVGIGQLDVRIRDIVDTVVVVFTPSFGDDIQLMKAGITEIADIFVVNKADEIKNTNIADYLRGFATGIPVIETIATNNKGIDELAEKIIELGRI